MKSKTRRIVTELEWLHVAEAAKKAKQRSADDVIWSNIFPRFWQHYPEYAPPNLERQLIKGLAPALKALGLTPAMRILAAESVSKAKDRIVAVLTSELRSSSKLCHKKWGFVLNLVGFEEFRDLRRPEVTWAIAYALAHDDLAFFISFGERLRQRKSLTTLLRNQPMAAPFVQFLVAYWADFRTAPLCLFSAKDINFLFTLSTGLREPSLDALRQTLTQLGLRRPTTRRLRIDIHTLHITAIARP